MVENASLVVGFIFDYLTLIFNTYTSVAALSHVLAFWVIYKVVKVFLHL